MRTERLAHCRNFYLDSIRANPDYDDINYVIIADLDALNSELCQKSILSCFSRDDWDVCFANQNGPYYDIYALRHPVWSPVDCWEQFKFLVNNGLNKEKALEASIFSKMLKIPSTSQDWIEVHSAFGGIAIYKIHTLASGTYVGITEDGLEISEHVSLHLHQKKQGFKLFINPQFINAKITEHSKHIVGYRKIYRLIKNFFYYLYRYFF